MERSSVVARMFSASGSRRRSRGFVALAGLGACALLLGACGGDDDDSADSSTTTLASSSNQAATTVASTTTRPTTTTTLPPLELVTEGATVMVANASRINGAAGRMSDELEAVEFTMATPGNSTEGPLEVSKIYYDPENANAKPVADSLRLALGGGAIEVLELAVPAPTDTGDIGEATVLFAMGNDTADKSLDELQGRVAPSTPEESTEEGTSEESTEEGTSEESTEEGTSEESTEEGG